MTAAQASAFVGSIPEKYDRYLGPVFFHHYADDLAARVPRRLGIRVLETACGTGILTERLLRRLDGEGQIVATDLNDAMIAYARRRGVAGSGLSFRNADATALPFEDACFDAVVCEFGVMFFPDKLAGMREAFRVLRPGGRFLFNTWDTLERNPIAKIAQDAAAAAFPDDPPQFYSVPFGLWDPAPVRAWLASAGFVNIGCDTVAKTGGSPSAADAATGLIEGSPLYADIMSRRPGAVAEIKSSVEREVAKQFGDRPVRCPLSAHVFVAEKP